MPMKKKKEEVPKVVVAEFKVSMYCNACERTIAKTISKCKGVERFTTNMNEHKAVVMGRFDPQKVVKKLKRKTGKKIEVTVNQENTPTTSDGEDLLPEEVSRFFSDLPMLDNCNEDELLMMFSDENPNACSIM